MIIVKCQELATNVNQIEISLTKLVFAHSTRSGTIQVAKIALKTVENVRMA